MNRGARKIKAFHANTQELLTKAVHQKPSNLIYKCVRYITSSVDRVAQRPFLFMYKHSNNNWCYYCAEIIKNNSTMGCIRSTINMIVHTSFVTSHLKCHAVQNIPTWLLFIANPHIYVQWLFVKSKGPSPHNNVSITHYIPSRSLSCAWCGIPVAL